MTRDQTQLRVLVVFGSKRGGTAGLARMIGDELAAAGCRAVVTSAREARDVSDVDAVIVAGALYAGRWHADARRFVRRHTRELRNLPVWLVSSGPLDDSAEKHSIPPTAQVLKLGRRIGARAHLTLGGRLSENSSGFVAGAMAKKRAGDWRNPAHVKSFVTCVLKDLRGVTSPVGVPATGSPAAHVPAPAAAGR